MRIAQVSFAETAGGAERVATDLHECFLEHGHDAVLLTPRPDPYSKRAGVIPIDVDAGRPWWERALMRIDRRLARPRAASRRRRGFDDPGHPWTAGLLDLLPWKPDVLHLHNLHGGWFDLSQLGPLSRRVPTVVTLHDAWLPLCGPHWPMHVEGWDAEALRANHALRLSALGDAPLTIVTPSHWMKRVWDTSPWCPKVGDAVLIPNGIDTERFTAQGDRHRGLFDENDASERRVLSVGLLGRGEPSHTEGVGQANLLATNMLREAAYATTIVSVGSAGPRTEATVGCVKVRIEPRIRDRTVLASAYRAADVLYHAVLEDNAPLTVLEAMACGTPVVAPRVGGIPELLRDGEHGRLYEPNAHDSRREALRSLLDDPGGAKRIGTAAAEHVRERFDRRRMAEGYLSLYAEVDSKGAD